MSVQSNGRNTDAPIILVSPDMRSSVMGVAQSLIGAGLLERFVTTLAFDFESQLNGNGAYRIRKVIQWKLQKLMKTRSVPPYLTVPIERFQSGEITRILAHRMGLSEITCSHVWEWAEVDFDHKVAERWAGKAPIIYGCENASVETFARQKAMGGHTILWQVIAHPNTMDRLLKEEYEKFPDAVTPYVRYLSQINDRINARKDKQYTNADLIITNSAFSRQTFIDAGFSPGKVLALPTGCPPVEENSAGDKADSAPIVFLCAGTQSIRKGIPYLLDAWRILRPGAGAELWLVGKMELPECLLEGLPDNVLIKPSVSRAELKELYKQSSYLVSPTLCEGLSHVILQAMSAGLGIITTENSGCGTLVEDGINGWKIPIRDAEALAEKLNWCLDNPGARVEMGRHSRKKAEMWQESDFAKRHLDIIEKFLDIDRRPSGNLLADALKSFE